MRLSQKEVSVKNYKVNTFTLKTKVSLCNDSKMIVHFKKLNELLFLCRQQIDKPILIG